MITRPSSADRERPVRRAGARTPIRLNDRNNVHQRHLRRRRIAGPVAVLAPELAPTGPESPLWPAGSHSIGLAR
jgi:hypothetical protein